MSIDGINITYGYILNIKEFIKSNFSKFLIYIESLSKIKYTKILKIPYIIIRKFNTIIK